MGSGDTSAFLSWFDVIGSALVLAGIEALVAGKRWIIWLLYPLAGLAFFLLREKSPKIKASLSQFGSSRKLRLANSELQSENAQLKQQIAVIKDTEAASSKLVIHSALYGDGSILDMDVKEILQRASHDALAVHVSNGTFGRDPVPGVPKHLRVSYSYDNTHVFEVSRPENAFLLLPEDSWSRHEIQRLNDCLTKTESEREETEKLLHWPHLACHSLQQLGNIEPHVLCLAFKVENDELRYASTAYRVGASIELIHENIKIESLGLWYCPPSEVLTEEPQSLGMREHRFLIVAAWFETDARREFFVPDLPPGIHLSNERLVYGDWTIRVRLAGANFIGRYEARVTLTPSGQMPGLTW